MIRAILIALLLSGCAGTMAEADKPAETATESQRRADWITGFLYSLGEQE